MASVTDLRNGTVFEHENQVYQVLSYEHIKMGRGSATIKVKVRNIRSGSTTEKSFISGERVGILALTKKDLQYLYKDEQSAYFMEPATFDQIAVSLPKLAGHEYLREGESFSLSFLDDEAISLNLPPKMEFKIMETGPALRGNSATNIYKDAILENGLKTRVPLFIKEGDLIRIDTRSGDYTQKV